MLLMYNRKKNGFCFNWKKSVNTHNVCSHGKAQVMISASVDIGTNSVLLLVAKRTNGRLAILDEKQEIPRLGKGVDKEKNLHSDSRKRVLAVLKSYKKWLQKHYPDSVSGVKVTATSAVRDAGNRDVFIKEVDECTGWAVQLLSGDEEVETTYMGALSVLPKAGSVNLVLDIGGGSTEIAQGKDLMFEKGVSFDMGSVRFSERFFPQSLPKKEEIALARKSARAFLNQMNKPDTTFRAIGVAGTVTSLAGIELGLEEYKSGVINGYRLGKESVENFINELSEYTAQEIEKNYPVFLKGRGDVILAGLLILDEFLEWCGKDEIIVSTGGVRHGILLQPS